MKNKALMMLTAASAMLIAAPAFAAGGGGGGGGGGLPSSSRPSVDPAQAFRDGIAALEAKDYKTAEKKFRDVLSAAPKHPEANYYMALAKIGDGKAKGSVRYLEKAIKERGNFVEARERLALVQIELGEPDAAREQLTAIEALKVECATEGACDEPFKARVAEALTRVTAALETPPPGEAMALEDPAAAPAGESAENADNAEEAPSEDAMGDEAPADGTDEEASDDELSLFFAPRDAGVAEYLAAVRLINEARYSQAIADLYRASAIVGPHPDILNYLGYSHRKLGQMEKARDYYAQALRLDPDHKGANEYLGELYLEIGETGKAKRQLAKLDRICDFGCVEREDLARLIAMREGDRRAER